MNKITTLFPVFDELYTSAETKAHFEPMATEGEERFLRSSYLLLKGTFYLAKKVLIREAENVHQQTGRDLNCLLKDYEQKLKHEFRHKKQREKLFPTNGKTNVENWDISLLIGVLLIVYRHSLPDEERKAIKKIKYQRNEVYAHWHDASLDTVDYTDTCSDLEDAFNTLASGCGDEVKQECDAIIQTCLNGALDHKSHVEQLKQLAEKDDLLLEILAKIETTGKEIINDLKNTFKVENSALKSDITRDISRSENNICNTVRDCSKKQREELRAEVLEAVQQALQGQHRIKIKVVDSQLDICGTDQDQDNIALAENIIVTVTNEAIRRAETSKENNGIREIIQEILDEISQTGVKPILAETGSVIIRFDCYSYEQLLRLIIYMGSNGMKERLNKLADLLSRLLNTKEKLQISFSLSLETLKSILDEIAPKVQREYKRSVHIPIQIQSIEGMNRVLDLFEGGGLTNNLQKLSEALTEKVGAKINVKPSINMKQLKEALQEFDTDPVEDPAIQIGKTEECRSEEGATGHKGELYVDAEEGGEESTQIKQTDHEEDIYVEREESEEQSIQEKPSDHEEDIYVEREEPEEESIQENPPDHEEYIYVEREEPEEQSIQEKSSDHEENIYVEKEEHEEQSIQEELSDHEKDINMEREEPKEQSIQEKTSAETSIQKNNAKDESGEENETDNEEEIYVDAKEPEEQNIQKKPTDHEEEIYVDAKEPEEQNIQKKPTVVIPSSRVQYRECLFRLQSLVIDVGTDVLRNGFYHSLQDGALDDFLAIEMERIKCLKQQKLITKAQFNLLYPPGGQPSNRAEFDDTLLFILAKYLGSFTPQESYECCWVMPKCIEVALHGFCRIMDEIVRLTRRFQPLCFSIIKNDIEYVLLKLNAKFAVPLANMNGRIKRCETKSLDPAAEQRNQDIFDLWEQIQFTSVIHLRTFRTTVPKKRKKNIYFDLDHVVIFNPPDINMGKNVTFITKDIKSSVTKEIEHGVPKRNETGGTYRQIKSDETSIQKDNAKDESSDESSEEKETEIVLSNRECLFRLQCLVIDVGTDVLRNMFDQILHGMALDVFLANEMEHLKILKQQRAITDAQFNLLYPPDGQPSNIAEFDVTLILLMLRYRPSVNTLYEYVYLPRAIVASIDTDLCRLCDIMDEIVRLTRRFQALYFQTIKTEIEEILLRLNATAPKPLANLNERIKRYENKTLNPAVEQRNQDIFYQWELIQFAPLIHLRPNWTKVPKKRQDFGDINPQVTIQNKKVDLIEGFRREMGQKQYVKQDVTSIKKDFKSIEADLKSIKTEGKDGENLYCCII